MTKSKTKLTAKQKAILEAKKKHPEMSTREIATIADSQSGYVSQVLQRYKINYKTLDQYKKARADVWLATEASIMSSMTSEDIQKEPMRNKIVAAGICADKIRDITGGQRDVTPMIIVNRVTVEGKPSPDQIIDVESVVNNTQND